MECTAAIDATATLRPQARELVKAPSPLSIDGLDLSAGMLEEAIATGDYDKTVRPTAQLSAAERC